eukprot:gene11920-biopygen7858
MNSAGSLKGKEWKAETSHDLRHHSRSGGGPDWRGWAPRQPPRLWDGEGAVGLCGGEDCAMTKSWLSEHADPFITERAKPLVAQVVSPVCAAIYVCFLA